jgi:hypothetical protein
MEVVIDEIKQRHSVRSFDGNPIADNLIDDIRTFVGTVGSPFGAPASIHLMNMEMGKEPVHLGTYGFIKGTNTFLALVTTRHTEVQGGYMMERVVLHCTGLGLGTCWLGGTVSRSDFRRHLELEEGEEIAVVVALGHAANRRRTLDSVVRRIAGSDHRKPFAELFFDGDFDTPLDESRAGRYLVPLQMLRIAPSASNAQLWRVLKQGDNFHFFRHPSPFSMNDMGIGICHFDLSCRELGMTGHFEKVAAFSSNNNKFKYVISWIHGNT